MRKTKKNKKEEKEGRRGRGGRREGGRDREAVLLISGVTLWYIFHLQYHLFIF